MPEVLESPVTTAVSSTETPQLGMDKLRSDIANLKQASPAVPLPEKTTEVPQKKIVSKDNNASKISSATKETSSAKSIDPTTISVPEEVGPLSDEAKDYVKGVTKPTADRFMIVAKKEAEKMFERRMAEEISKLPKPDPSIAEEAAKIKVRASELETELKKVAIERTPEFKEQFVERPKAIRSALIDIAKSYEIPERELFSAIEGGKEGRKRLNELLETVGIVDRVEAAQLAKELSSINDKRSEVLSDHEMALKLLEGNQTEKTKAYVQKLISDRSETLKTRTLPLIEKEYGIVFDGEEGQELKNAIFSKAETLNSQDLETMPHHDRAALISAAFMAQPLLKAVQARDARIADLETQLSSYDEITPPLGGSGTTTTKEEEPKGFIAKFRSGKLT